MDVRELAPALLSLGKLFEESARVANLATNGTISVRIKHFEHGSFGINIEIMQSLTEQLVDLFSGKQINAIVNLIVLLGLSGGDSGGLWQFIKKAKGRKPGPGSKLEDGNIQIAFGNDHIIVEETVLNLYRDIDVRTALAGVVRPLSVEGIDRISISLVKDGNDESATKEEIGYFAVPEIEDSLILEEERVAIFSIHSLSFKEDNKWRLSDGTNTFFVLISDDEFLRSVDANTSFFAKGDRLKVQLKINTWETAAGIRTDYEAVKIVEHLKSARQIPLTFE